MLLTLCSSKRPASIYGVENKRLDCINPGSGRYGISSQKLRATILFNDPEQRLSAVSSFVHSSTGCVSPKKIPHTNDIIHLSRLTPPMTNGIIHRSAQW